MNYTMKFFNSRTWPLLISLGQPLACKRLFWGPLSLVASVALCRLARSPRSSKVGKTCSYVKKELLDPATGKLLGYTVEPRRCHDCGQIVVYDEREIPHCFQCGLIFGEHSREVIPSKMVPVLCQPTPCQVRKVGLKDTFVRGSGFS